MLDSLCQAFVYCAWTLLKYKLSFGGSRGRGRPRTTTVGILYKDGKNVDRDGKSPRFEVLVLFGIKKVKVFLFEVQKQKSNG